MKTFKDFLNTDLIDESVVNSIIISKFLKKFNRTQPSLREFGEWVFSKFEKTKLDRSDKEGSDFVKIRGTFQSAYVQASKWMNINGFKNIYLVKGY